VAFAQKPEEAILTVEMLGGDAADRNHAADLLVQGIAWIDKSNFQIIQLRTDLLVPRADLHLDRLSTTVSFGEVKFPGFTLTLWLPSSTHIVAEFSHKDIFSNLSYTISFQNEHQYTEYQAYHVDVKMVTGSGKRLDPRGYVLPATESDENYYEHSRPYMKESLPELAKQISELKNVRPASDQEALPDILKKTAANVDDFFRHIVDLTAREEIVQARLNFRGMVTAREVVQDNYLILRQVDEGRPSIGEFRMDAKGKQIVDVGLDKGFLVTFGFALTSNYFSSNFQPESRFRYLGDQKLGPRDTYVIAFAQQPGIAKIYVTLNTPRGMKAHMLNQGIAWIDKSSFQVLRIRTDLLAPHPEISLEHQTTEVTFNQVHLPDVDSPFWLPKVVKVDIQFKLPDAPQKQFLSLNYQNEHRYSDYRRYRVSVKMLTPQ
jgi:hypothetical protein